ncbi:transporter substrate-binding domain-containing protein [Pseudomonas sp. LjRoot71]|uniref:substrate-binding periplasmic protein n=1 Tax=Pseudomonas sp. LjRoot71 TaxID=3342336 RepID=UPI003ED16F50
MQLRVCLLLGCLLWGAPAIAQQWQFATEEFPPFTFSRGGKPPAGAVTEMVQAACAHLREQCRIDVMPWGRALRMGEEGLVDGIFTVIRAPEREQAFYISRMLVESRYDIYGPLNSTQRNLQAADLGGRRVGVYGPSGTLLVLQRALRGVADVQIETVANNQRLLLMLEVGRFGRDGVVVLNRDVARHLITWDQLRNVRQLGQLESVAYGVGFSRKKVSFEQFQAFDRALGELAAQGVLEQIARRYGVSVVQAAQ